MWSPGSCGRCSSDLSLQSTHIIKTSVALAPSDILVENVSDEVKEELQSINYAWRKFPVGRIIAGSQQGGTHTVIVPLGLGDGQEPRPSCQLLSETSEFTRGQSFQVCLILRCYCHVQGQSFVL